MSKAMNLAKLLSSTGKVEADDLDVGQVGGRRNLIINGAMQVAQRGTSYINSGGGNGYRTVDRWGLYDDTAGGGITYSQDTDAPVGFKNSLKATCNSAFATSGNAFINTKVEGQNSVPLSLGNSNAKTFTLSFWVKSSIVGTWGGAFRNGSTNRSYAFTYTISTANTWEYKTVTLTGDTSGTWNTDASIGIDVSFGVSAYNPNSTNAGSWGSTNSITANGVTGITDTTNATWKITGVQLELGSVATPFEHRSYGEELALCQRYYQVVDFGNTYGPLDGYYGNGNYLHYCATRPVTMRTDPSATITYGNVSNLSDNPSIHDRDNAYNIRIVARANNTGRSYAVLNMYTADAEL